MRTLVGRFAVLAAASTFLVACGGGGGTDDGGSESLRIAANGNTSFSGTAGTALTGGVPSVKVTDEATGTPKAGVGITFSVTGGGGTLAGATQTTNAEGIATVSGWTLGTAAGANSVRAVVSSQNSLVQNFTATGAAGAAARLAFSSNPAAAVTAGAPLGSVQVEIGDQFGNATGTGTNDITISLGANPGGSTLGGTATVAAVNGRATFNDLTLNKAGANYRLSAASGAHTAATGSFFNVNAAGAAAALASAGASQAGEAGSAVATLPAVRVADAFDNPVAGVAVTFAVSVGGGSVTGAAQTTNTQGIATVGGWTLGAEGANALTAAVAGVATPVTFSATAATATIRLAISSGQNQIAQNGRAVPMPIKVLATNQASQPLAGRTITFSVASGNGSVATTSAVTDATGIATLPGANWTLGSVGVNGLKAKVAGGDSVTFSAQGIPTANYDIQVRFTSDPSTAQRQAFASAATRWSQVIVGDLSNFTAGSIPACTNSGGAVLHPAVAEAVDDLVIFATLAPIDGPGQTLGSASPCYFRSSSLTAVTGMMTFDTADLQAMENNGSLNEVILHEMGHVIGLGTLWNIKQTETTYARRFLTGDGAPGVFYNAPLALAAFNGTSNANFFTGTPVPVEDCVQGVPTTCGVGTRDGHWREFVFKNELMTGYISATGNPLSRITLASLQDMNYTVDMNAADAYAFSSTALFSGVAGRLIELRESKRSWSMKGIDENGRVRQVIE